MVKAVKAGLVIAICLGLASCTESTAGTCAGWAPIRLSADEVSHLSDETLRQVVAHNQHGANTCGWKA
jgi:hypothetical protein